MVGRGAYRLDENRGSLRRSWLAPSSPIYEVHVLDDAPVIISRGCKETAGKVLVQMLLHLDAGRERIMDIERRYLRAAVRDGNVDIVYSDGPGVAKRSVV